MSDLLARLQSALGDTYAIERELGGGGMSRVFLAEETALRRKVVIKLLPPEMSAGVNRERFEREIQLSASLQHPHVVSLLTTGAAGDLLYYVMPYIPGESLRAKLAREGELPVSEALQILREVMDALAYAHRHGVVHRDIKPDNVLLSEGHAVVTDFGVAKAVSASSGNHSSLTSLGVALGTPAYMSPEQAAADPHVDHRADIYAVGAMAYEMLTARPPFTATTPQQILAAHVSQAPDPVTQHRSTIPPALADLVMRCLAKRAADRWQTAGEIKAQLEGMATPQSGGMTPTGTAPVSAVAPAAAGLTRFADTPVKVAGLFLLASAVVLLLVYAVIIAAGLPDWVFIGAVVLLAAGLPIILVTGTKERERVVAATTGLHLPTPTGLEKHLTWRRALGGGGVAFAGLAVVAAGFMAMRTLGIGPLGTLVATGVLDEEARLVLADFDNATSDSTLGETVGELFRIDLNESPAITLLSTGQVVELLARMERPVDTRLTPDVVSEMATREGIKAFVAGDIRSLGASYLISARLVSAETGEEFISLNEQASTSADIMAAVDRMSATFRERIGESYSSLRADPPLDRITTSSLEALQLYSQATRAESTGDLGRAIALLEQAVSIDSTFAMAWRRMGAFMERLGSGRRGEGLDAIRRAFALREPLAERERYHIEAMHALYVELDREKAVRGYLSILDKYPRDDIAINNLAVAYGGLGNRQEQTRWYREGIAQGIAPPATYMGLIGAQVGLGNLAAADTALALFEETFPTHSDRFTTRAQLATVSGAYDLATAAVDAHMEAYGSNADDESFGYSLRSRIATVQGRLDDASRWNRERLFVNAERRGQFSHEHRAVIEQLEDAEVGVWYDVNRSGPDEYDARWTRWLDTTEDPVQGGAWETAIRVQSRLGEVSRAQALLDEYRSRLSDEERQNRRVALMRSEAEVALASERADEAVSLLRTARDVETGNFGDRTLAWFLAEAYDRAGNADSALAYYELYLDARNILQIYQDSWYLPPTLRRLGELYEARGDREQAAEYYGRFAELWAEADPELQPIVEDVRARVARLATENR